MKIKAVVSAILALSLATGGHVFAQGHGERNDRGDNRGRNEQAQRGDQQDRHNNNAWQPDRRDNRGQPNNNHERRVERGAGPNHQFYKGQRLPAEYRHSNYVVEDWRGHHLNAPPRGYHWVQTGGDYILVAIASGIILQLLLNN